MRSVFRILVRLVSIKGITVKRILLTFLRSDTKLTLLGDGRIGCYKAEQSGTGNPY